jgi:uncharacterized damage-inducible protein DinB
MKPNETEYHPYFKKYIDVTSNDDLLQQLTNSGFEFEKFVQKISSEKADYKYAENKWTIKQLLIHLIDTERIFAYRALAFCRGEKQSLHGFNENEYADNSKPENRTLENIIDEFWAVRNATIHLFKNLDDKDLQKTGIANDASISVRAIGYILVGHQIHHFKIITEKYL